MTHRPTGTATFLFTDIEGSTKLAQDHEILNQSVESNNGYVFQIVGDSFAVAFHSADDARNAASNAQQLLQKESYRRYTHENNFRKNILGSS